MENTLQFYRMHECLNEVIDQALKGQLEEEMSPPVDDQRIADVITKTVDDMVKDTLGEIEKNLQEYDASFQAETQNTRDQINDVWGEALGCMRMYLDLLYDASESYKLLANENKIWSDKLNTAQVIRQINGKAIQVFSEVLCLLENGFTDGATAHYRSLFELWIFIEFFDMSDDNVAKAYIDSLKKKMRQERDALDWAKAHPLVAEKAGEDGVSINVIIGIVYDHLRSNKGMSVSKKMFLTTYNFSNLIIHPSSKGVFGRAGVHPNRKDEVILVGTSDYGLENPARNAMGVMTNIAVVYLKLFPNTISLLAIRILRGWVDSYATPKFERKAKEMASLFEDEPE